METKNSGTTEADFLLDAHGAHGRRISSHCSVVGQSSSECPHLQDSWHALVHGIETKRWVLWEAENDRKKIPLALPWDPLQCDPCCQCWGKTSCICDATMHLGWGWQELHDCELSGRSLLKKAEKRHFTFQENVPPSKSFKIYIAAVVLFRFSFDPRITPKLGMMLDVHPRLLCVQ